MLLRLLGLGVLACLLVGHLALVTEDEVGITMRVDPGKMECFYQHVPNDKNYGTIDVSYMVIKGGDLDINFFMKYPKQELIVAEEGKMHGRHTVELTSDDMFGDYTMCLDNTGSYQTAKVVAVHFYLLDKEGNFASELAALEKGDGAEALARIEYFDQATTKMKTNFNQIENEQRVIRNVEYLDRSLAEHNFENINFWGIVNTSVMLIAAFTQVFLIRSILSDDSKLGRLLRHGRPTD